MRANIGVAALLLLGIALLYAFSGYATEPTRTANAETLQEAREVVARSYGEFGGPATLAHIVLRPEKKASQSFFDSPMSGIGRWLANLGIGKASTIDNRIVVEVFARTKSGEEIVIDHFTSDDFSTVPLIMILPARLLATFAIRLQRKVILSLLA
jgi:hypothetical protein